MFVSCFSISIIFENTNFFFFKEKLQLFLKKRYIKVTALKYTQKKKKEEEE